MRAHIVKNGIIVNTIEVESLDVFPDLIDGAEGAIGWRFVDGKLIEPISSSITNDEILSKLQIIDNKSIRALREGNVSRINSLENEAIELRSKIVK